MTLWLFLAGIAAPAIFWSGYFYIKDRYRPEPLINLGLAFLFGIAAAFLVEKIYLLLAGLGLPEDPTLWMDAEPQKFLFYTLGIVGPLEELFKALPFLLIVLRWRKFDEPVDGIVYAAMIALGFASYENLVCLPFEEGVALLGRSAATPLTHTVFAWIWGYPVGMARLKGKNTLFAFLIFFPLSAAAHGLFDYLNLAPGLRIVSALLILALWGWRIALIERLQKRAVSKPGSY